MLAEGEERIPYGTDDGHLPAQSFSSEGSQAVDVTDGLAHRTPVEDTRLKTEHDVQFNAIRDPEALPRESPLHLGRLSTKRVMELEIGVDDEGKAIFDWHVATKMLMHSAILATGSVTDAEDLVQETLLRASRSRGRYEPGTNAVAWMFRIMRNTNINRAQSAQRRPSIASDMHDESGDHDSHGNQQVGLGEFSGLSSEEIYFSRHDTNQILQEIDKLPDPYDKVVRLFHVHKLTYEEIAETLEVPVGTVMSRLYRGRRQLRKRLASFREAA